ncbi:MAG: 1-acyl-sn-glycerol-3-phosphate acyltransferase [Armatimonadetes bacterium]|nr:1-acyl-sn-glycerol-3-phosphate acyltransferase [Armatimonadota bacterium]MDW8122634.1 lysophospholipid acyltransferase family protein [Armatimonadota bacterium]
MTKGKVVAYRLLQRAVRAISWALFQPLIVGAEKMPKNGGLMVICNHPSYLDPILLGAWLPRPLSFVAKRPLFKIPFVRTFLWLTESIPVEQDAPDRRALRLSIAKLKSGGVLAIFPEGTRSDHGRIRPGQLGPALIAIESQVPILPCGLAGVYQAWSLESPLPRPAPIALVVGEPLLPQLFPNTVNRQSLQALTDLMMADIKRLVAIGENLLNRSEKHFDLR